MYHFWWTVTPEEKSSSDEASRRERKVSSATVSKTVEDKLLTGKRRPRTVTCYICGREFGTASFPIHEPKCLQVGYSCHCAKLSLFVYFN